MANQNQTRETRVLQVVLSLDPGGTERLVLELMGRLMPEMPMAVCCLDELGEWGRELKDRAITATSLQRRSGFTPSLGRRVARAARQHRANVIHAHQYTPFVYSCLSRWWQKDAAVVFTEHGRLSDAEPSGRRRLVNRVLRKIPKGIFAVSHDLQQFMVAEGFRSDGVKVIYNGIDIGPLPTAETRQAVRVELGIPDDVLLVGAVGRLDPVKSLDTLLHTIVDVARDRSVGVLIVGDGPERSRLEALTDELGLRSKIQFLGQRKNARRWLAGCDLYVNSSTSEGVSLTILEAMAAGLPVVVTRVGGTPEVVTDACGMLVPPRNPAALASAIRSLAADRPAATAFGLAGRARVETHFTIERMVREYADVYRAVSARTLDPRVGTLDSGLGTLD